METKCTCGEAISRDDRLDGAHRCECGETHRYTTDEDRIDAATSEDNFK